MLAVLGLWVYLTLLDLNLPLSVRLLELVLHGLAYTLIHREKKMTLKVKLIAFSVYSITLFITAWQVKSWQVASIELAAQKAAEIATARERSAYAEHADKVEKILTNTAIKERVIETKLQPIIKREVYQNNCMDDDGLDLINGMFTRQES